MSSLSSACEECTYTAYVTLIGRSTTCQGLSILYCLTTGSETKESTPLAWTSSSSSSSCDSTSLSFRLPLPLLYTNHNTCSINRSKVCTVPVPWLLLLCPTVCLAILHLTAVLQSQTQPLSPTPQYTAPLTIHDCIYTCINCHSSAASESSAYNVLLYMSTHWSWLTFREIFWRVLKNFPSDIPLPGRCCLLPTTSSLPALTG